ncbi:hypothetical protein FHX42_002866 [Saccharopolyspora lacisalsi]|uniref:Uncharacterized protein n=1 Tax=Halosaccharopolyspora lacisalsi TaxID=1000566 RepID=A0A839E1D4_9PSEU|nr:hypothetical protein [Halosaccharopolyspora lacisalsi]
MAVEDKWTSLNAWVGLGTDALGMLPVVGPRAKGGTAATEALHVADGLVDAGRVGAKTFADEASNAVTKMAEPADVAKAFGNKVASTTEGADTVAKVESGHFQRGHSGPGRCRPGDRKRNHGKHQGRDGVRRPGRHRGSNLR